MKAVKRMSANSKIFHGIPPESLTIIKPHKLGRNYHLIPQHIKDAARKHARVVADHFLRNYRINIELAGFDVQENPGQDPECIYQSPLGKVGVSIERGLLIETLESYYGGTVVPSQDTPPATTSEQRMRQRLGVNIIHMFARALLTGETFGDLTEQNNDYEEITWEYVVRFDYLSHITGTRSSVLIFLDAELADELVRRLGGPTAERQTGCAVDNIKHLPVKLECVVVAAQMPLSQVLSLEPDDILMVRPLDRYEIRINQQRCFQGTIFEADGALYLTSLESVKSE